MSKVASLLSYYSHCLSWCLLFPHCVIPLFLQTTFAFVLASHSTLRFDSISEFLRMKDQTLNSVKLYRPYFFRTRHWRHVGQGADGLCKSFSPPVSTLFFTSLSARWLFLLKFCYISSVGPSCWSWKSLALVMERLPTERALCVWVRAPSYGAFLLLRRPLTRRVCCLHTSAGWRHRNTQ